MYPGNNNSLKLVESLSLKFSCSMNLIAYPFDTQNCVFIMRLNDVPNDFVKLVHIDKESVEYLGPRDLREYTIKYVELYASNRGNYSGKAIRISLENLSGFYVCTTYIPTFFMVAICYSTFYYNLDDFNDRIMISLTALLVLATLFTQITETTPKTAYLKLLDIWFVSAILMNFVIIMILVVINFYKLKEGHEAYNATTPVISLNKKSAMTDFMEPELPRLSVKLNRYSRIGIPILISLFIIIYMAISVWMM